MKNTKEELENAKKRKDVFHVERRLTHIIGSEIPKTVQQKKTEIEEIVKSIERLNFIRCHQLMQHVLKLGPGKSFGELAVQKDP